MEEYVRGEGVHKSKSSTVISDFDIEFFSFHNVPRKCSFICLPNTSHVQLSCLQMEKGNQGGEA